MMLSIYLVPTAFGEETMTVAPTDTELIQPEILPEPEAEEQVSQIETGSNTEEQDGAAAEASEPESQDTDLLAAEQQATDTGISLREADKATRLETEEAEK